MKSILTVNGIESAFDHDPRRVLLDALCDSLGLTGTKKGATTANAAPAPCW